MYHHLVVIIVRYNTVLVVVNVGVQVCPSMSSLLTHGQPALEYISVPLRHPRPPCEGSLLSIAVGNPWQPVARVYSFLPLSWIEACASTDGST